MSLDSDEKEDNSGTWSYKSTILAGQAVEGDSQGSTENSYQTARSGSVAGCSWSRENLAESLRFKVPSSMNRAIDVEFVPQSDLELSTDEPRSSSELNRNIESSDKSSQDSEDTNYKIKTDEQIPAATATWERYRGINSPRYGKMAGAPTREDSGSKILKRFSQEFMASSHRFTEKMLTIIDESESGYENVENSAVNLSRMTREFRKMCKYIQDESMPEHMNSTIGFTKDLEEMEKGNFQAPETIEESPIEISSSDDSPKTREACVCSPRNNQKTPINRFKNAVGENQESASPGSPNSTKYFVSLEKYLNEETMSPRTELACRESRSTAGSDVSAQLRDKEKMVEKCEQQLAALDDSNHSDFHTFESHCARGTTELEFCDGSSVEMVDAEDLAGIDDDAIDEDGLSMSLRLELEKQRERCFETARRMQKIEEDAKASNEDYTKVLERLGIDPEVECRKTIQSLMTYQSCRAKLRRNELKKKNETSSIDSGIDTRSRSRTLQLSSKKSNKAESSSRVIESNSRRCETLGKPSETENTPSYRSKLFNPGSTVTTRRNESKKTTAPQNSAKKSQKTGISARSGSPSNLGSTTKLHSRSRSRENKLPSMRIASNPQTCRTSRPNQTHEKTTNVLESKEIGRQKEKSGIEGTLRPFNKQHSDLGKTSSTPLANVESPILRYHMAPPRSSPIMKQQSVEKIANSPCTESLSPVIATHTPRNRYFITPGKPAPVMAHRRLGPLFKSPVDCQQSGIQRIIKSPHAPGIYRNGFNGNVISPVRAYIHGTDMNLIQNVMTKTNAMLLTPTNGIASEDKINFNHDAKKKSISRDSPRRHRFLTPQKVNEFFTP